MNKPLTKIFAPLCLLLALSACSSSSQSAAGDPPEYFANLSEKDAEGQLAQVQADIEELDKEIRGAEARRDQAQIRRGTDATKDAAYESGDAEVSDLQTKKGFLINRQMQLEKRLRILQGPAI
jgi:hypothetical protein